MKGCRVIRAAVRWTVLIVLFLVVLELCARLDDWLSWGAPLWGHYSHEMLTVRDELGIHSRPNTRFEKWRINAHGFRGPDITMAKPAGVRRVVILGASETFGLYESPGKDYPAQVRAMLGRGAPGRYQVLNAGCAGMTLPRITHYFRVWIRKFDPDVVFIYPTPASYVATIAPRSELTPRQGPPRTLPENSRLAAKTKVVLQRFLPAGLQRRIRERALERAIRSHGPDWVWRTAPPERVELFRTHLTELIGEVRRGGVRVIVGTHAHRFAPDPADRSDADRMQMLAWRRFYPRASAACLLDMDAKANEIIAALGEERGVRAVDLASVVTRFPKPLVALVERAGLGRLVPKVPNHFADFAHFTDDGAWAVATELVRAILEAAPP